MGSSDISTQARVVQGDSSDTNSNGATSVPGLSKIPLMGGLFRNNDDSSSHLEQVFLPAQRMIDF
ncbi:hypothetical protein [Paraburkholderia phenazinium]|jgi:type III secretion protein C|uniref:hypothetical protein n=1 Tax=Paraburkholderia sp. TaxID=1926495 RepID=UPI000EFD1558